jgi:hypothetical protein
MKDNTIHPPRACATGNRNQDRNNALADHRGKGKRCWTVTPPPTICRVAIDGAARIGYHVWVLLPTCHARPREALRLGFLMMMA